MVLCCWAPQVRQWWTHELEFDLVFWAVSALRASSEAGGAGDVMDILWLGSGDPLCHWSWYHHGRGCFGATIEVVDAAGWLSCPFCWAPRCDSGRTQELEFVLGFGQSLRCGGSRAARAAGDP